MTILKLGEKFSENISKDQPFIRFFNWIPNKLHNEIIERTY